MGQRAHNISTGAALEITGGQGTEYRLGGSRVDPLSVHAGFLDPWPVFGSLRIPERTGAYARGAPQLPGETRAATLSATLSHESNEAEWNVGGPSTCLMS